MWFEKAVVKKSVNIPWLESTKMAGSWQNQVRWRAKLEWERKKENGHCLFTSIYEPSTCRMPQSLEWWCIQSVTLEYITVRKFVRSLCNRLRTKCTHMLLFNSVMEVPIDGASTRSVQVKVHLHWRSNRGRQAELLIFIVKRAQKSYWIFEQSCSRRLCKRSWAARANAVICRF